MSDVVVQWNDLQEFTSTVFAHAGMSEDDAALEAVGDGQPLGPGAATTISELQDSEI